MTSLGTSVAALVDHEAPHRPHLSAVVRHVAHSLFIACAVPAAVFYACLVTVGVWPAILAALAWSYAAIAWRKATGRRTSGLLILTAIAMTGRTAVSVVADSTFLYFLQPIISDGVIAAAFLLSLATSQPLVARLAGDFYPMDHELHLRPRIRRLFWRLTLMWAVIGAGKAAAMLWLLLSQSVETFVLARSIFMLSLNIVAAAVTIVAAATVARREGLMGPARAGERVA
jgi:hypothetical protein